MNLADALVPRSYTNGEAIIRQGDSADGMYFIEDGTVRVVKVDHNGVEKEVFSQDVLFSREGGIEKAFSQDVIRPFLAIAGKSHFQRRILRGAGSSDEETSCGNGICRRERQDGM